MIRAGIKEELNWDIGTWSIIDLGFAANKSSCGLLFGDENPRNEQFGNTCKLIIERIKSNSSPHNLVIEAPLSVAFKKNGNPTGRIPEKNDTKHRYWYVGPGIVVMVAATYLLKTLYDEIDKAMEIRLFEGFVSFSKNAISSDHSHDVLSLKNSIKNQSEYNIIPTDKIAHSEDILKSAFEVFGMDFGIPPIIIGHKK